jgi:glycosyltransferase involved in cell wall biosynthesis
MAFSAWPCPSRHVLQTGSTQQITDHKTMKIAFVNQGIGTILPPYQNSVGACTYGVTSCLAKSCEVIVYGCDDPGNRLELIDRGLHFRFFPSRAKERVRHNIRRLISPSTPVSTAACSFPAFGRQVAADLQKQHCDFVHVPHCSQFVPMIRALNPNAKIVLQLHAKWFSQNDHASPAGRLRDVDLVTTVSDYITQKTRLDFPMITDRVVTTYNGIDAVEFNRVWDYRATSRREDKRILYAGAVSPHKGIHVLLDAFKMVVQSYPRVRLEIVGPQRTIPLSESFDLACWSPKNDAPALARALLELLENDNARETMGRGARKRALSNFTWARVAESMYEHYRALCNTGSVLVGAPGATD